MQTAAMTRTSGLASSSRISCNRNVFQQRSAAHLPVPCRRTLRTRAENENASTSGGSITNDGTSKGKDSYEKIEAPVRGNNSADQTYGYDGKPINQRQSDVDRLLIDQDEPEEKSFLGTEVAFPDALRFKGAAPEVINSRLAMLGVVSALAVEWTTGKNVFQQVQAYSAPIFFTFALWIVASLVPILRGVPRRGNAVFKSGSEINFGRLAMLGFVALLATEYLNGGVTIPHFYGLQR